MKPILVVPVMLLLCACSSGEQEADSAGQAWQEQIDTLEKAQEVEDLLGQTSKRQQQNINDQTR